MPDPAMRLELTRRTDLALRMMQALEAGEARCKASELAEAVGSSRAYVTQVLSPLVRAGWITSEPGPTGGYRLRVPLASVSLLSLIETCEGPTDTDRCVLRDVACSPSDPCALHEPWLRARTALLRELDAIDLSAIPARWALA